MITFKYWVMNSWKTTNLIETLNFYEEKWFWTYLMKPEIDTKWNNEIVSRMWISRKVDYLIKKEDDLYWHIVEKFWYNNLPEIILIDEVQFLTKEHIYQLIRISHLLWVKVVCYWLRTDFKLIPFEASMYLLSLADEIEEIKTICWCWQKAVVNVRYRNWILETDWNQIEIDDKDDIQYNSICHNCYLELIWKNIS